MKLPKYILAADLGDQESFSVLAVMEIIPTEKINKVKLKIVEVKVLKDTNLTVHERIVKFRKKKEKLKDKYNIKED